MASQLDPTVLHRSRSGSVVQLLLSMLFGSMCLWVLVDMHQPQQAAAATIATTGTALDPTPDILFDEFPRERHQGLFDRLTGGWFGTVLMSFGAGYSLWSIVLRLWYLLFQTSIMSFYGRLLVSHGEPFQPERMIALGDIRSVVCDRADRLPEDEYQQFVKAAFLSSHIGMRLGQKLRHILRIEFIDDAGQQHILSVVDISVEGGREQLERFAAYLQMMVAGEGRTRFQPTIILARAKVPIS
jgi:hypothetical protein